jgi:hypothetical protein
VRIVASRLRSSRREAGKGRRASCLALALPRPASPLTPTHRAAARVHSALKATQQIANQPHTKTREVQIARTIPLSLVGGPQAGFSALRYAYVPRGLRTKQIGSADSLPPRCAPPCPGFLSAERGRAAYQPAPGDTQLPWSLILDTQGNASRQLAGAVVLEGGAPPPSARPHAARGALLQFYWRRKVRGAQAFQAWPGGPGRDGRATSTVPERARTGRRCVLAFRRELIGVQKRRNARPKRKCAIPGTSWRSCSEPPPLDSLVRPTCKALGSRDECSQANATTSCFEDHDLGLS